MELHRPPAPRRILDRHHYLSGGSGGSSPRVSSCVGGSGGSPPRVNSRAGGSVGSSRRVNSSPVRCHGGDREAAADLVRGRVQGVVPAGRELGGQPGKQLAAKHGLVEAALGARQARQETRRRLSRTVARMRTAARAP